MKDKHYVKALQPYWEKFQNAKEEIVVEWVSFFPVEKIFIKHSIEKNFFITRFANGVFDYFMRVIAEEVTIGQCPVMEQFLHFLKDVDISSQELFEICTHFKRSMIDFSFENDFASQDVFNAITHIFDRNFSSILQYYSDTIYAKEQEIIKNMELLSEYKKAIDESSLVYKLDSSQNVNYVNRKLLELSGYDADEIIGKPYDFLCYDETQKERCENIWSEIEQNGIYQGIVKNRKKEGGYFYLQVTILRIFNPYENDIEYMVIAYDVTTLIDARIEAVKASEAKEYFLSNMSHEIRTPLNAILGFVSLLLDEEKDTVHKKYLQVIASSGENLLGIINDILDFSKIRSGEFVIEPRKFSVYEELENVLELFKASALEKQIHIESRFDENMPKILYGDILRIKQIVSNFLSNAVKFTSQEGKIVYSVSYEDGVLEVDVTDNGIGIKKENLQNIFHAFMQVKQENGVYAGTGLGLSISYQLAKQMGGEIFVESIYGLGSRFGVKIPLEAIDTASMDVERKQSSFGDFNQIRFDAKVLVADDNEANRELMCVFLAKFGIECDVAEDGKEAVELYKKNRYDLLLMDEQMPRMDGTQALRAIRSFERQHTLVKTPICAVSANVIKGDKEFTLKSGFDDFLGKPIDLEEFQNVLKKFLSQKRSIDVVVAKNTQTVSKSGLRLIGLEKHKLLKELALNEEELGMLLGVFLKKRDAILPQLQEAIRKRDLQSIAKLAHNIKGSSGNFRLEDVQKEANAMETAAKESNETFAYEISFAKIEKRLMSIQVLD